MRVELCSRCGKPAQPTFTRRSENEPQPWRFCQCGARAHFPDRQQAAA